MSLIVLLASVFTFVELNCENLFDTNHDPSKQDIEFLPDGLRHWNRSRYFNKLNNIGKEILSCSSTLPDLVALCEVENDSVMHDLTRRSLLRNAGYNYLMTDSKDLRGIDVALLYNPRTFFPLCYEYLDIPLVEGMRPTRDILYVKGMTNTNDTLCVFVIHAPSRYGGEKSTRTHRKMVAEMLCEWIKNTDSQIIVAGDFNDYADSPSLKIIEEQGLINVTRGLKGRNGVKGTYRFKGEWHSLDHIFMSPSLVDRIDTVYINDSLFLLEEDSQYGGYHPKRTFSSYHYQAQGFSDHLPLVVSLRRKKM